MKTSLTPYQKRKHQQALDEKYLENKLIFLAQNKSDILHSIHKYRVKHFVTDRNHFVHTGIVTKLLNTNKRTIRLLATRKYISTLFFSSYSLFSLSDVRDFIKSLD
ncbi:MAG: hypothetical protein ACYC2P_06405 [Paludibacteraceae bacterium]